MSLNAQDKIMIIITAIVMLIELFIFYFNNVSSKSAQMHRYALNGGITKAKRVADNEYHLTYYGCHIWTGNTKSPVLLFSCHIFDVILQSVLPVIF